MYIFCLRQVKLRQLKFIARCLQVFTKEGRTNVPIYLDPKFSMGTSRNQSEKEEARVFFSVNIKTDRCMPLHRPVSYSFGTFGLHWGEQSPSVLHWQSLERREELRLINLGR